MDRSDLVRASLERFEPADARERDHRSRCLQLLQHADDAFARDHFRPGHLTASAFVLSPDRSRLLLIHHRTLERWLQPGGHFEPQDDGLLVAARREVAEEVGVDGVDVESELFDVDVHLIPARGNEPAHEHFDLRVLVRAQGELVRAGPEVYATGWFALGDIDAALTDASVVRAVAKLRARF